MADKLTLLSVFSGCGGLDLGLEHAGFLVVGCIENDPAARASLQANRPKWPLLMPAEINALARKIKPGDLGLRPRQLSMLAGAPPCQPFSKAAQWSANGRQGSRDRRSNCLTGFLKLVDIFLPKVFLIENVPGFVQGRTSCLQRIERALRRINQKRRCSYRLQWNLVDAADYGVPQHRARVILVAVRDGRAFNWPAATHRNSLVTAWDAFCSLPTPPKVKPKEGWLELLPTIPEGGNYIWHTRRGGGYPLFGYRTRFWSFLLKLSKERPSWTLSAQPGPYTGPFHWDNRALSYEEQLRLQSLPASWHVTGPHREILRQIGNATPSLLAEVIGGAIASQIFGRRRKIKPRLLIPRAGKPAPKAARRARLPSRYHELIGIHPDHAGTGRGPKPTSPLGDRDG